MISKITSKITVIVYILSEIFIKVYNHLLYTFILIQLIAYTQTHA